MVIVPVMDLKGGVVVRGVAGQRESYQPITSELNCDASPAQVAAALRDYANCDVLYVADLDAIGGGEPDWHSYEAIGNCGATLWIDAGVKDVDDVAALQRWGGNRLGGIVVALETLPTAADLRELSRAIGAGTAIFSLDLKQGTPITHVESYADMPALAIAADAYDAGFRRFIVLDLAGVGVDEGVPTTSLCAQLRKTFADIELISGGGVRNKHDLKQLTSSGCDAALIASALHARRL